MLHCKFIEPPLKIPGYGPDFYQSISDSAESYSCERQIFVISVKMNVIKSIWIKIEIMSNK